jgi:hypothetical protein
MKRRMKMPSIYSIIKVTKSHDSEWGKQQYEEFIQYCSTYSEALRIVDVLNSIAASNVSYHAEEVTKIEK